MVVLLYKSQLLLHNKETQKSQWHITGIYFLPMRLQVGLSWADLGCTQLHLASGQSLF